MRGGLPAGWVAASLGDVITPRSARADPAEYPDAPYVGLEHVEPHTNRLLGTVPAGTMASASAAFKAGDVLYGRMRPYLNKVVSPSFDGLASAEFIVMPAPHGIASNFLLQRLSASDFTQFACSQYEGDRPRVKFDQLANFELLLPPAAEQTRIVAKLEELLSDLDAGVAELKAAQLKLQQYRQSLLKAAVEGSLTRAWREANPMPEETGADLLARILRERRARWEAQQLARFEAQSKTPPKGWQSKYPEPAPPSVAGMPTLPDGWAWASLNQLLESLRSGSAETSGREPTAFPVLKSSAVRQGHIDFAALNYLNEHQSRTENLLADGDLLITRLSGSVEYVGCAAVARLPATLRVQYPDRIFCGKLLPSISDMAEYLALCLGSIYSRARLEAAAKSTAGHKRISLSDLLPFPIPMPPRAEIAAISREIAIALARSAEVASATQRVCAQSTAQRQNLLRAALAGQLVPQDPADEPAAELLARIRAERAAAEPAAKRSRSKRVST